MITCPESLPWFCGIIGPHVQLPSWNMLISFLFGSTMIVLFAIDHYKTPTYAKTTIGDFIEIPPEYMTTDALYRRGKFNYIGLMLMLYIVICTAGASAMGLAVGYVTDPTAAASLAKAAAAGDAWPLAAATLVTMFGTASDKTTFGRLELALRSLAHESAYIPKAVTQLADDLVSAFDITDDVLQALDGTADAVFAASGRRQTGAIANWIRAQYLFTRLELLQQKPAFNHLFAQPENVRAYEFLRDQRDMMSGRIFKTPGGGPPEIDAPLRQKIDAFERAVATFLAALLWRGCSSEADVASKITELGLKVPMGDCKSNWSFALNIFSVMVLTATIAFLGCRYVGLGNNSSLSWNITLAFTVLLLTAHFAMRRRERLLKTGNWANTYEAYLRTGVVVGVPVGVVATLIAFGIHPSGPSFFFGMLFIGVPMAVAAAIAVPVLLHKASTAGPTDTVVLSAFGGAQVGAAPKRGQLPLKIGCVAAGMGFGLIALLFWISEQTIIKGASLDTMTAVRGHLASLQSAYDNLAPEDAWFAAVKREDLASFKSSILATEGSMAENVVSACKGLNARLAPEKKLFSEDCRLNTELTRDLGDGKLAQALRNLGGQLGGLPSMLAAVHEFERIWTAVPNHWPRALGAALIWAAFFAAGAISVLQFRRKMLWQGSNAKKLNDYAGRVGDNPATWACTPIADISNIEPIEAVQHDIYRSRLSDLLRKTSVEVRQLRVAS